MSRTTRMVGAGLLALALLAPAGCVRMPQSGPVVQARSGGGRNDEPGIYIDPKPPQQGESAPDIVKHFLDAMTATPIQTNVAKQFLAKDAQASWNPELETITYADASPPRLRGGSRVSVTLDGADHLDGRGRWQGGLPRSAATLRFPMTIENGEYRIAQAPDALVVPESWFEQRFRQVSLYFFDPTARILAPEPVFVPRGEQLATTLTKGLLRGPDPGLSRVERSFIPAGLTFGLSVPVSAEGVADLSLRGDAGQQTPQGIELMVAQLAWTLRQEPTIQALRVSVGGQPVNLPGGESVFSVDQGAEFDPTGFQASSLLFGLRAGLLVSGLPGGLVPVDGPWGATDFGLSDVAVNLDATTAAGLSGRRDSVLVAPVRAGNDERVRQVVSDGTDLLRPVWDFADRLWLVDRTTHGAQVSYVVGDEPHSLRVPGITGRPVKRFLVSRDGTRLVAAVSRPRGDVLLVSRILHDDQGNVLRATRAQSISSGDQLRIRDIAWHSSSSVAVLHPLTQDLSQVRTVSVDGSPPGIDSVSTTLKGRVVALVSSPVDSEYLYAVTNSSLIDLSNSDQGTVSLDPKMSTLGYVG